jgi:hypothetical protein
MDSSFDEGMRIRERLSRELKYLYAILMPDPATSYPAERAGIVAMVCAAAK